MMNSCSANITEGYLAGGSRVFSSGRRGGVRSTFQFPATEFAAAWRALVEDSDWFDPGVEHVIVAGVDQSGVLMGLGVVAVGSDESAHFAAGRAVSLADVMGARRFILAHNDPAGVLNVSRPDRDATEAVVESARRSGMECLDHLVMGRGGAWLSVRSAAPDAFSKVALFPMFRLVDSRVIASQSTAIRHGDMVRTCIRVSRYAAQDIPMAEVAEFARWRATPTPRFYQHQFKDESAGSYRWMVRRERKRPGRRIDVKLEIPWISYKAMVSAASKLGCTVEDILLGVWLHGREIALQSRRHPGYLELITNSIRNNEWSNLP